MTHAPETTPLPCPFCGGLDQFPERMGICVYQVHCNDCAAKGPPVEALAYGDGDGRGERAAIKAWNRRRAKPKSSSEIDRRVYEDLCRGR